MPSSSICILYLEYIISDIKPVSHSSKSIIIIIVLLDSTCVTVTAARTLLESAVLTVYHKGNQRLLQQWCLIGLCQTTPGQLNT